MGELLQMGSSWGGAILLNGLLNYYTSLDRILENSYACRYRTKLFSSVLISCLQPPHLVFLGIKSEVHDFPIFCHLLSLNRESCSQRPNFNKSLHLHFILTSFKSISLDWGVECGLLYSRWRTGPSKQNICSDFITTSAIQRECLTQTI